MRAVAVLAALLLLLAVLAASLMFFDRSDPAYRWLAGVFLLIAIDAADLCFAVWAQIQSAMMTSVIRDVFLRR